MSNFRSTALAWTASTSATSTEMPGWGEVVPGHNRYLGGCVARRRDGDHPPHVHRNLEAEQVDEEVARLGGPIGLDVGHRPAGGHVRRIGASSTNRSPQLGVAGDAR